MRNPREQPPVEPRRGRMPTEQALREASPWLPVPFELADATAIQALAAGTADMVQQRRAWDWILRKACGLGDWAYHPGQSDRDTNIALGRQFVGHQIMKLQQAPVGALARKEPHADAHEPKA